MSTERSGPQGQMKVAPHFSVGNRRKRRRVPQRTTEHSSPPGLYRTPPSLTGRPCPFKTRPHTEVRGYFHLSLRDRRDRQSLRFSVRFNEQMRPTSSLAMLMKQPASNKPSTKSRNP
jgi:hypothetical protein